MSNSNRACVTVIGGGLAGTAASIHLANAGLQVRCLEAETTKRPAVGESLDWSAPGLLGGLGLPMDRIIKDEIGTYKCHVTLKLRNGSSRHYVPGPWLGRRPFNVELRTMHVDRSRLDAALRAIAVDRGVQVIRDKVAGVEQSGRRVVAVTTALGHRFDSPWFIDASGAGASLFPRAFRLPVHRYGSKKVAIWTYFNTPELGEGTTLYAEGERGPYLEWVWEIPIRKDLISVGYVASSEVIKEQRRGNFSIEDILRTQLSKFSRFEDLLKQGSICPPSVTTFQCLVRDGVAGSNWLVVGEAASMVDPMTSNGVTSALRHAAEAASLIVRSQHREQLHPWGAAMYNRRSVSLGRFFNDGIEKVIYDRPIRKRLGTLAAGDVYTVPAWSLNYLYSRLKPTGVCLTAFFGFVLCLLRATVAIYYGVCKRLEVSRETAD